MHTIYLGVGSNLGDRQSTILAALQRLRAGARIEVVSSFYETPPANGVAGPAFLNLAAKVTTELDPVAFERFVRGIETAIGRQTRTPLDARPIDVDLLLIDALVADFGRFEVPHPYLAARAFNLVPLAEIAPGVVEPRSGKTIAELAAAVPHEGIARKPRSMHFAANRQEEQPEVRLSLNRVGVSSVKHQIRLNVGGEERLFQGDFTMVADLAPDKAGVHMSRFSELLEAATLDVLARKEKPSCVEELTEQIAREIVGSQGALRADVRLRAEFALERWTPVSGKRTEETYTLIGIAHADAQPVATHNQRGRGGVYLGAEPRFASEIHAEDLVEIVESSMSSETYGLLKRPDEFFIVNKAHHNPKFVEDVVRGILARALDVYADFPDTTYIGATQVNDESIHKHDAFAEAFGLFGEFRRELREGVHVDQKTDLATWLGTRPSPVVTV